MKKDEKIFGEKNEKIVFLEKNCIFGEKMKKYFCQKNEKIQCFEKKHLK